MPEMIYSYNYKTIIIYNIKNSTLAANNKAIISKELSI